mmetsp:Transcript_18394/g.51913  ORF Transcript_18394/g.51913 Transcript_18394/m.51913 type:complete len:165 (+) Transcript_18394:76-570(+)|eukprot:CAMPEP_0119128934 /NCGR_PEP_ID=MMETSP1310-20130426/6891_1 /TAXON_ID=464262 /ORGANISM="Genus nov. species nov., Strain RCC2339" /LENGTH=164 /DNA_ID=CAMNT_0007119323 /DNA_START=74 /DNA_END=568 /DNA_ORIENTATION=-
MSQWGRITLWDAAADGNLEVLQKRLQMELAKIDAQDSQGKTAMHEAARWDHAHIVKHLVEVGATTELADTEGRTALHVAAAFGQLQAITALIECGAEKEAQTWDGDTPLHLAAAGGHVDATRLLLDLGANAGARNGLKKQPRDVAANTDTAELFREKKYISPTK